MVIPIAWIAIRVMHLADTIPGNAQTAIIQIAGLAQYLTIMLTQIANLATPAIHQLVTTHTNAPPATAQIGGRMGTLITKGSQIAFPAMKMTDHRSMMMASVPNAITPNRGMMSQELSTALA